MKTHLKAKEQSLFAQKRLSFKSMYDLTVTGRPNSPVIDHNGRYLGPRNSWGDEFYVDPDGNDSNSGKSPNRAFETITEALTNCANGDGDVINMGYGQQDEGNVVVNKSGVTIVSDFNLGASFLEPETAGAEGIKVTADDVTIINFGIACDDTGDYALNLNAAARFRAFDCKIEGADTTGSLVLMDGTATDQVADVLFAGHCEFAYAAKCFTFDDSSYGYPTQVRIEGARVRDVTTNMFGVAAGGLVKGLNVLNCSFENTEASAEPTDYILLSDNLNTGYFAGNYFATATNATGVLTIGTGINWGPNGTEAGWSTARPA